MVKSGPGRSHWKDLIFFVLLLVQKEALNLSKISWSEVFEQQRWQLQLSVWLMYYLCLQKTIFPGAFYLNETMEGVLAGWTLLWVAAKTSSERRSMAQWSRGAQQSCLWQFTATTARREEIRGRRRMKRLSESVQQQIWTHSTAAPLHVNGQWITL